MLGPMLALILSMILKSLVTIPGLQLTFRSDSVSLTQIISEWAKTRLCAIIAREPYVILIFFAK
jgi:hypothetical protein